MRSLGPHTRRLRSAVGALLLVTSLLVGRAHAQASDPNYVVTESNDIQVLNYLLNLEYLFAEFYTCATTGSGIRTALRGGGPASVGCTQAALTGPVAELAAELAASESSHVAFLRTALGDNAVPIPPLDISAGSTGPVTLFSADSGSTDNLGAWSNFANQALGKTLNPPFTPYDSNLDFIIGAYILEDVMVTAFEGQIRFVNALDYVFALQGMIAAEGYHAGAVRELLIEQAGGAVAPYGIGVNAFAQAISNERATLSGTRSSNILENDDQWILNTTSDIPILVPSNGYTFERTDWQVLQVFTLGADNSRGLFFPSGINATYALNGSSTRIGLNVPSFTVNNTHDQSIFAFALNLEYLESDFYSWLVYGERVGFCPKSGCPTSIGAKKGNLSEPIFNLLAEIAAHEYDHAAYFRTKAGPQAFPFPQMNFTTFADIADAAMGRTLDPPFDPFADDMSALIAAYILEDVGVTAYKYAVPLISDRSYLRGGSGICALEAYHAGAVRLQLLQNSSAIIEPWGVDALTITQKISALRASASHANDDIGVSVGDGRSTVINADSNSLIWGRTPAQVVNIITLGSGTGSGGFFPEGLTGVINGTAGSGAAASLLPPALPPAAPAPAPVASAPAPSTGAVPQSPAARAPSRSPQSQQSPAARGPSRSISSGSGGVAVTPITSSSGGVAVTPTAGQAAAPTAAVPSPVASAPAPSAAAPAAALNSLGLAMLAAAALAAAVLN